MKVGEKYNNLVLVKIVGYCERGRKKRRKYAKGRFQCFCGNKFVAEVGNVQRLYTQSCGCLPKGPKLDVKIGQKFGMLTLIKITEKRKNRFTMGHFKCSCGNFYDAPISQIKRDYGMRRDCGCGMNGNICICGKHSQAKVKNGLCKTRAYISWRAMLRRCYNADSDQFNDYGGRGIQVCFRWHEFVNFYKDMGERPKGLSIERKNNNGNYESDNCYWATRKIQANNRRLKNV